MKTTLLDYLIEELLSWTQKDKNKDLLEQSLKTADEKAGKLDRALYAALQWPTTLDGYVEYLYEYARWIPKQSTDPAWRGKDGSQEPYDRLCHFYWLIDQEVTVEPNASPRPIVEYDEWFQEWLDRYADAWGGFLDTTESFSHEILQSFIKLSPRYSVEDSMIGTKPYWRPNEPSGWLTFNQFFARQLNSGLRPIDSPGDNKVVTSPADCTYKAAYDIDDQSNVVITDPNDKKIRLKMTHPIPNIQDLLKDSPHNKDFAGGTFVHYFLSPYSYHRFHLPVIGHVLECRSVQGLTSLEVNITDKGLFDAPDKSGGGYEFAQSRGIVVVDTGDIGLVAIVPVGMAQVSSVNMTMIPDPDKQREPALKGDEFGYFLFGGSDIIVLFQKPRKYLTILERPANPPLPAYSDYFHYGNNSVTFPDHGQG